MYVPLLFPSKATLFSSYLRNQAHRTVPLDTDIQISTKEDVEKLFDVIDALDPAHKKMISASHFFMWWSGEIGRGHNHQSGQSFHMTHPRSSNLEALAVAELAHRHISADDHPKPGATQCTEV